MDKTFKHTLHMIVLFVDFYLNTQNSMMVIQLQASSLLPNPRFHHPLHKFLESI
jgi:hypothetical protein